MLLLSFYIGSEQYSLRAKDIVEVLPLTRLQKIPKAPEYIVGLLDYRGTPAPVIDLCKLVGTRTCNKVLSTRIIIINYIDRKKEPHFLGITAEKVTETFDIGRDEFANAGVTLEETPYLGAVISKDDHIIRYIEINNLLPEKVQTILFQENIQSFQVEN